MLIRSGNPHNFQPYTIEILKTDKQKADWQDKDQTIALVKTWLKEKQTPASLELNYRNSDMQSYRKFMTSMELRPVAGTEKTILVRKGLMGNRMDQYCLPREIAGQVIQDMHLYHMHLGIYGILKQAQKCVYMPSLRTVITRQLSSCQGCMQKHKV